jgi:tRNA(Ile)-lysidine synthase
VTSDTAIGSAEFLRVMEQAGPLQDHLAIAVSGGIDSMCLLRLLIPFCQEKNIRLTALTVDHHLRKESADEAKQVAAWCKNLGVAHVMLEWNHEKIASGIQDKARSARYQLMFDWMRDHDVVTLLTAHHLNDQLETLLFRLSRKSGMRGLAAIHPVSIQQGITLTRPLLAFPKARLKQTLESFGQEWLYDPSNDKSDYTRNHIRSQLPELSDAHCESVTQITDFFRRFDRSIDLKLHDTLLDHLHIAPEGYATFPQNIFAALPEMLKTRAIEYISMVISGDASPIRSEKMARILDALSQGTTRTTFHGCVFSFNKKTGVWLVTREAKYCRNLIIPAGKRAGLWDGRFSFKLNKSYAYDIIIRPLGTPDKGLRKALEKTPIPKAAWPTLPSLWHLEECITIPHIYQAAKLMEMRFIPAKSLADGPLSAKNTRKQRENVTRA